MADTTSIGDRMKTYEHATRFLLPHRTYTVIRVDGRAFHSLLRDANRPFDTDFMTRMDETAAMLCQGISGAFLAYTQSDEISVLMANFGSVHAEPWFGGVVQKMASVAASAATAAFNAERSLVNSYATQATFDARVFTVPSAVEVANYLVWRQQDATRNSISMAAQAHFPHERLHRLDGAQMQELLWSEKNVNWNDYPDSVKRGRICHRVGIDVAAAYTDGRTQVEHTTIVRRLRWVTEPAPRFTAEPDSWLAAAIPPLPSLTKPGGV